jgi:predicted nucleotidyltransferase
MNDAKRLLLWDIKWRKIKKLSSFFAYFPFIDFVLVSGSMATGNVKPSSDFDLLISVKEGRLFFTRYVLNAFFSLLGKRRKDDLKTSSPDKLCFNHFITRPTWKLKPFDDYGPIIYKNLVPLWGDKEKILAFFRENLEYNEKLERNIYDLRYNEREKHFFAKIMEKILGGKIGDFLEKISRHFALKRLNNYLKDKKGGRVIVSDKELEFHFYH